MARRARLRWGILAVALIALAGLAAYTLSTTRRQVEAELTYRGAILLAEAGEQWASVHFQGRDGILEGEALAEEARAKVRNALAGMFGVRQVRDATTLLPERRPFTFSVVKDGRAVAFDGYVPSRLSAARIVDAARTAGFAVTGVERLTRARGAPPGDFAGLVIFGLDQLSRLPSGRVTLSDGAIAIEGRAPDLATYKALAGIMQGPLPGGLKLARFAVRPPVAAPFAFTAARQGDAVRLTGYVPSEQARAEVLSLLGAALPGVRITDEAQIADGAPATDMWLKAVRFAGQILAHMPQGRVALSDSSVTVEGAASGFAAFDALNAARRAPPEGFQVMRFTVEPPRAQPFVTTIDRGPETVRLTGYVPSEEARKLLVDAARSGFAGVPVADEMRLASGGPPADAWAAAANFAVTQLARLRTGKAELTGTKVKLSGEALDSAAFVTLRQAAKTPPETVSVDAAAVRPPTISPYVFAVRRDGDGLTVSGFYPDEAAHMVVRAALERHFLQEKVNDLSAIGSGAPEGFADAVLAGLAQLARTEAGDLSLADTQLRLAGTVHRPAVAEEVEAELKRALKAPFAMDTGITVASAQPTLPTAQCQAQIADLLGRGTIAFDTGSARIDRASLGLLDRLAATLQRCPSATVVIGGHTDAVGDASANQRLSEARANAVLGFLTQAGVDPARLSAVGYGATRPVAGNDTEAGRARNRRIEFVVSEGARP